MVIPVTAEKTGKIVGKATLLIVVCVGRPASVRGGEAMDEAKKEIKEATVRGMMSAMASVKAGRSG